MSYSLYNHTHRYTMLMLSLFWLDTSTLQTVRLALTRARYVMGSCISLHIYNSFMHAGVTSFCRQVFFFFTNSCDVACFTCDFHGHNLVCKNIPDLQLLETSPWTVLSPAEKGGRLGVGLVPLPRKKKITKQKKKQLRCYRNTNDKSTNSASSGKRKAHDELQGKPKGTCNAD